MNSAIHVRPEGPRVLHLAQSDSEGGANKAAYRLHASLRAIGVNSVFHPGRVLRPDAEAPAARPAWLGLGGTRWAAFANAAVLRLYAKRRKSELFSPSLMSYGKPDPALVARSDVICLHWIAGAFLRPAQLRALGKPLVWRLSDLWPFTGGCHYPGACRGFEQDCGACPVLGSDRAADLSRLGIRQRARAYEHLDLTIVAPSRWIAEEARRSRLFAARPVVHIPTGVDLAIFRPRPRREARARFGLPEEGRVILFGALGALDDPRKGFADFCSAIGHFAQVRRTSDVTIVLFGGGGRPAPTDIAGLPVRDVGRIDGEDALADLYAAGDLLAAPFKEDNLPNVVLEAIACGTPVAAYAAGGIPDAVRAGESGALAPANDPAALAEALRTVLCGEPEAADQLRRSTRALAEHAFDLRLCAEAYARLFEARTIADRRARVGTTG